MLELVGDGCERGAVGATAGICRELGGEFDVLLEQGLEAVLQTCDAFGDPLSGELAALEGLVACHSYARFEIPGSQVSSGSSVGAAGYARAPVTFDERIRELEDQQGSVLEDHLLYERVIAYAPAGTSPGVNQTFRAVLDSGRVAYHKPFSGVSTVHASMFQQHPDEVPVNECAAWRLAYRLGSPFVDLVAPTVLRDIRGEAGSLSAQQVGRPNDPSPFLLAPRLAHAAAFIDSLIAQQDRHGGNTRWDDANQKLGLIDHGYTFALPGHRLNAAWFVDWRWAASAPALDQTEVDALDRLLGGGDLLGLRAFLLPVAADHLEDRAHRMLAAGEILAQGDF